MNVLPLFAAASLFASAVLAQVPAAPAPTPAPATPAYTQVAAYPLETCVVSGKPLGATAVTFTAANRAFRTCTAECRATVEKDPAPFARKLDDAVIARQLATYPLEVCPITGLKLGSMGAPAQLVLDDTLVQLCCAGCTGKAQAGKAEIVARIREAAFARQNATPSTTCAVTGEPLAANAGVRLMLGTKLVCVKDQDAANAIRKEPTRFLAKVAPLATVAKAAAGGCGGCASAAACTPEATATEKPAPAAKPGCCGAMGGVKPVVETPVKPGCCEEAAKPKADAKPAGSTEPKKND